VWSEAETRRCSTLLFDGSPDTTVVLEPGPVVGGAVRDALTACVMQHLPEAPYLILTGSLPPDFPAAYFAVLTALVNESRSGVRVCIDSSGEVLRLAAQAGPWLVKVNRQELCLAFGVSDCALEYAFAVSTYRQLQAWGVELLIVTDGPEGAYVFSPHQVPFRVRTRVESWVSTAGAGDTFMAALSLAFLRGSTIQEAACYASAAAAANLQELGCGFFDPADVERFLAATTVWDWTGG
jgi:fructose-1-phosphate kinase PfkB-like protein